MKNNIKLIKLFVVSAALIACGILAFKFMYKRNAASVKIQQYASQR